MKKALLAALLAIAALVALACGGGGNRVPASPSPGSPPIELNFDVPSDIEAGQDVTFRLTVTNVGNAPLELGLGGRADGGYQGSFGFFIATADGEEVTCKLCANGAADASLSYRTLQPGEEMEFGWDWDQTDNDLLPVPPGTYSVYGTFNALDVARNEEKIEMQTESRQFVISP
ncbi:MAG: hypothetical protein Q8Q00_14290 [Dehalococcoidia bacterium]|nr:hypothetical protein [Dehalococcoidia bacterium]